MEKRIRTVLTAQEMEFDSVMSHQSLPIDSLKTGESKIGTHEYKNGGFLGLDSLSPDLTQLYR